MRRSLIGSLGRTGPSTRIAAGAAVAVAAVLGLLLSLFGPAPSARAATGLHISNGRLVEANGNDFVLRGVNHPHAWYTGELDSLGHIKDKGANAVRVVLSSGDRWTRNDASDVANVVDRCKANRLICVLEVHDTTGYGEESAAVPLSRAADYWISIRSALEGQENYVIINIGNEPHGNSGYESWAADTSGAIATLRDAGFDHTLMVDAPNWGQDWTNTMRDNAQAVYDADPAGNTIFSIHMYGVYESAATISDYLNHFVDAGLPINVGEFGHNHSDGDPDEDAILATAQSLGVGYLGWSWSGNGGGVEYLDMVDNFDPNAMTSWGERIFDGPNGIAQTAEEATIYEGSGGTDGGTTDGGTDNGGSTDGGTDGGTGGDADCSVAYTVTNEWSNGFQGEIVIRNSGSSAIDGWTLAFTFPDGQSITNMWGGTPTQNGSSVSVEAASYTSTIPVDGSVTVGFTAGHSGSNGEPDGFALNGSACEVS